MGSINTIRELLRSGDYEAVLSAIETLENKQIVSPELLVVKAICIQLNSGSDTYSLADVEQILLSAIDSDAQCQSALIELGWFYLNVQDQAAKALPLFEKASEYSLNNGIEASLGVAKSMCEVSSPKEALNYLQGVQSVKSVEIEELRVEIEKLVESQGNA